jgi:cell fate regulator YaaT (PSP1 superfamily)
MDVEILEIAFKAGRIGIYTNPTGNFIGQGSFVMVEGDRGVDLGRVLRRGAAGDYDINEELKPVTRPAKSADLRRLEENRKLEEKAIRSCKEKIAWYGLIMNLVDAEYQWDRKKLTFYFTSDQRVDFREIVKDLAVEYRTRIEMWQIGVRDAAKHTGGYGTCGCPLCCTLFLKKFENITTQYVKEQLIPMNTARLTGTCGRLKCCLVFERDYYLEAFDKYPRAKEAVDTPGGRGLVEKIDIFNDIVYVQLEKGDIEKFRLEELQKAEMI